MASVADEQLARTKTINMRHVYVIGVIALAPTRVPAGENGTSPISLYPAYTDLSFAFNLRPILTSFSYYDFRLILLEGKKIIIFLLLLFSSFETNATETERNGTEIDDIGCEIGEERTRRYVGTRAIRQARDAIIGVKIARPVMGCG